MHQEQDVQALRTQIAALEARNREIQEALEHTANQEPRVASRSRGRTIVAVILVLVGILIAPVAVVGTWARVQLVDTDRFVQTFAPLAEDPAVQSFVASQASAAIEANVDIDGMVGDLFDGISSLDLPPRALASVALLKGPAADGVRSLINSGVERVVASPQFAQLWEGVLRETHGRAIAVIQGDPNTALQLSEDGTLSLELKTLIDEVKTSLVNQGFGFAENIPEIDRAIPLLTADALVLVRTLYQVATAAGFWLPWLVLTLVAAGVATARNRVRALGWAGLGLTVAFLLLASGLGIGRRFFVGAVSPSVMPASAARAIFDQLTLLMSSAVLALTVLSGFIAVGAWLAGRSRAATALRTAGARLLETIRTSADAHGLNTGSFGRLIERWHSAIVAATIAGGILVLFLNRPMSLGGVILTLVIMLFVLLIVELVRRPGVAAASPGLDEAATG